MNTYDKSTRENKTTEAVNNSSEQQMGIEAAFQFADLHPTAIAQMQLQEMMNNSTRVKQLARIQQLADQGRTSPSTIHPLQLSEASKNQNSLIPVSSFGKEPIQKMAIDGRDIEAEELTDREEPREIIAIWEDWIQKGVADFASWAQALLYAKLAEDVIAANGDAVQQATIIHQALNSEGSERYLAQVNEGGAGVDAHHKAVVIMVQLGIFRDVEQYMNSYFGPMGRYVDIVAHTKDAPEMHIEVKDFALDSVPPESRQEKFRKQLWDNIIWAINHPGSKQRYMFEKGVPRWAHDIMVRAVAFYRQDYPRLVSNIRDIRAYDLQAENGDLAQVYFYLPGR